MASIFSRLEGLRPVASQMGMGEPQGRKGESGMVTFDMHNGDGFSSSIVEACTEESAGGVVTSPILAGSAISAASMFPLPEHADDARERPPLVALVASFHSTSLVARLRAGELMVATRHPLGLGEIVRSESWR